MASVSTQRLVIKTLLSLPSPILRMMSGGGVVYRGGRTLDPRLQFLSAQASTGPAMSTLTPDEARRASAQAFATLSATLEPGVRTEPLTIPGPGGELLARAYRPDNQDPAMPILVYAHMGGGVIGDLETCDSFCGLLASVVRCPVVSVGYRLAPEHRYPAGLEDVLAAYHWGREHAARFGAPQGQAAIGGDSMGGHFAAIVAQEMRRAGEPQPALQLLIYPCVDVASETASMTTYADAFPLSRATMDWFMGHYMNPQDDPTDPRLSPIREKDLAGLAPAVVVTAGFDPLVDQGEAYAKRLRDAGAPTVYRCYDSLAHGFTAFTGAIPCAEWACREIAGLVREGLEGRILMRALVVEELAADYAGCVVKDIPTPDPKPGEVLIRVKASAVNFPDLMQTRGEHQHKPTLPFTPGMELAGEIVKLGEGVAEGPGGWQVGDAVAGGSRTGGMAEYAVSPALALHKKPETLSFGQAAGYQVCYLTAYVALVRRARVEPGQWVLVHGAAGGVGLACVDMARLLGCKVIAASASDDKLAIIAAEYAPDATVNVTRGFEDRVKELTGGRGADVIYDPVGGDIFDESVRCIAFDGAILSIGFTSGRLPVLPVNYALIKGFSVMGVRAGEYGRQFPQKGRENNAAIWKMAQDGLVKPRVHEEYPLDGWQAAFDTLADRKVVGKTVVRPDL